MARSIVFCSILVMFSLIMSLSCYKTLQVSTQKFDSQKAYEDKFGK